MEIPVESFTPEEVFAAPDGEHEPESAWSLTSANEEAEALAAMVARGALGLDEARKLIEVPPGIEALLRAFARECRIDGANVKRTLAWRGEVSFCSSSS